MPDAARRVVITGAAGTLGTAVADAFARTGARLALIDRAMDPGRLGTSGHDAAFIGGVDLADFAQARSAMERAVARLSGIDVLVNVAGGFRWETVLEGRIETWDLLYTINLKTAVCACKAALPYFPGDGGRIINVGAAAAAAKSGAGMGAYTASKAGVAKLTEALAEELKDKDITVNAVLPSIIDTPANRNDMPKADFARWVKPESLAEVILFLASDAARAVTGALIPVLGRV